MSDEKDFNLEKLTELAGVAIKKDKSKEIVNESADDHYWERGEGTDEFSLGDENWHRNHMADDDIDWDYWNDEDLELAQHVGDAPDFMESKETDENYDSGFEAGFKKGLHEGFRKAKAKFKK